MGASGGSAPGVAWVTGASAGIGRALCLELARRGWTVAATARRIDDLESLAREPAAHGRIVAHVGDVRDARRMAEIVTTVELVHGPLALAVLNAGRVIYTEPGSLDPEAFAQVHDVNVQGTVNALAAVLAAMTRRSAGSIAVVASLAGYRGLPRAAIYGSSKAALIHLVESLRFQTEPLGVRLHLVNPGFVATEMTTTNDFPMPFLMKPDEAARRICDGLERGRREIVFPRRLAWPMKVVGLLPERLYTALLRPWLTRR